jgi:hypothetical protein
MVHPPHRVFLEMARDPNHEVRKRYEKSLGVKLGSLFAELWQELVWLHTVWQEYRVIFATTPEQLDIANQAARSFFYTVQKTMWEAVLLHLARMTDPPQSMRSKRRQNLTVTALQGLVKSEFQLEVAQLTNKALQETEFARDWRNRYIAHKDLPLALGDLTAPALQPASRQAVERALKSLDELLNAVDLSHNGSTTVFRGIEPHTGANRLLQVLQKGLKAEEAEELEFRRKWSLT